MFYSLLLFFPSQVRTINIYYTNRTVQNAIELKNKRNLWRKAKSCHLTTSQSEVKIDFSLPIIACNVMIEFAEFYDNLQVWYNPVIVVLLKYNRCCDFCKIVSFFDLFFILVNTKCMLFVPFVFVFIAI